MAGKGRPGPESRINEESLRIFEQGLAWGWSAASALRYAGICESSFYEYQKRHPELRARYALIRERPYLLAKRNLAEAIEAGDLGASHWLLERRDPEYRPKASVAVAAPRSAAENLDEAAVQEQLEGLIRKARTKALACFGGRRRG